MADPDIAEIPYPSGGLQFRYARKLSTDGARWIRDGLFEAFHPDGGLASTGHYRDGVEHDLWRDFHPNGRLAAEGLYERGARVDGWRYWGDDGALEAS